LENISFKKKVLFFGMPDMALVCYDRLHRAGVNIVGAVPSSPKNPGFDFFVSFLKNYNANVITYQNSLSDSDFLEKIKSLDADIAVVCSYNKLFPPELLKCVKDGFINCHPSLLPDYRGPNPYSHTIINNEQETGMTLHFMNEVYDTGDIIFQQKIQLHGNETMGMLFNQFNFLAADMLLMALEHYETHNEFPRVPQPQGDYKYADTIFANNIDNCINWTQDAESIERFVRALNPFIVAVSNFRHNVVRIMSVEADKKHFNAEPGMICDFKKGIGIATGRGTIYIKVLQFGTYLICGSEEFIKIYAPKKGELFE